MIYAMIWNLSTVYVNEQLQFSVISSITIEGLHACDEAENLYNKLEK
jgi:hypothetical protein